MRRKREKRTPVVVTIAAIFVTMAAGFPEARGDPPSWVFHGTVAGGLQFDAARGPSNLLHIVSDRYYQLDDQGSVVLVEDQGDERQGALDFPPAIAIGDDGTVHMVTRHGGDFASGHQIRYRRRTAAGQWDLDYYFGTQVARNYVVGVAWSNGHLYMAHSDASENFWGVIHLFEEAGGSASYLGQIQGIWRADADIRMRGFDGKVYLASGVPDPGLGGKVFYLSGNAGPSLLDELSANRVVHSAGQERKGGPDLYVGADGSVHFSYGAEFEAYYNQYSPSGQKLLPNDARVMTNLGLWQMKYGISAVAASDSGSVIVMVALKSNGTDPDNCAEDSSLLWSYSTDGGQSFSAPQDMGHTTTGGCGRLRPRLTAMGEKFFLLYKDNDQSGISLATLEFESTQFSDFSPSTEVADLSPDCSVKVRNEVAGLDPSSASCEYSTNGGTDWIAWPATCSGTNGTKDQETITALAVPFMQESSTLNLIRFRITSAGGLETVSEPYSVSVVDPGTLSDAGPILPDSSLPDAGDHADAGTGIDGGGPSQGGSVSGGCSCRQGTADDGVPIFFLLLLTLTGLAGLRRRRGPA